MDNKLKRWVNKIFGDKDFFKKLFIIAFPITLQNLISSSLNMIDTLMIGKVGEKEIAAVGLANQMFLMILMTVIGLVSGSSVFMSQFWGKKDIPNIRRMLGISLIGAISITTMATIAVILYPTKVMRFFTTDQEVIRLGTEYLLVVSISYIFTGVTFAYNFSMRSLGKTTLSMIVSVVAVLINIVGNYIFIFGNFGAPAMGVAGAALGTTIARVCETIILITAIYKTDGVLSAKLKELIDIPKSLILTVAKPMFFVLLNEMFWGSGTVVYAAAYGHINAGAAASVQIANTITNFFTVIIFGMSSAAATMVGNKIGEGDEEGGKLYAIRIAVIGTLSGLVLSVALALCAPPILSVFSVSPEVAKASKTILYITAGILTLRVFNIMMIVGIQRGGGDVKMGLIIEGTTMWCVGVPMALAGVFLFHLPVQVVVAMVAMEEVTKCMFCLYRFLSGKWMHNVIEGIS